GTEVERMIPVPVPTSETQPFWNAAAEGRLVYQRCVACARAQFPPRSRCAICGSKELAWLESRGLGVIHSFTVVHRAPTQAFKSATPYVIALVDLDDGFRMMMNVRGCDPNAVAIGARIRVVFEP